MNRQTTYFLQKVLTGLATSVIYAVFDNYRYNNYGYNNNNYKQKKSFSNKKKRFSKHDNMKTIKSNYARENRY